MVQLYMICRTCRKKIEVGFGSVDDSGILHVKPSEVRVRKLLNFLAKHTFHDVSLITTYQITYDDEKIWEVTAERPYEYEMARFVVNLKTGGNMLYYRDEDALEKLRRILKRKINCKLVKMKRRF